MVGGERHPRAADQNATPASQSKAGTIAAVGSPPWNLSQSLAERRARVGRLVPTPGLPPPRHDLS